MEPVGLNPSFRQPPELAVGPAELLASLRPEVRRRLKERGAPPALLEDLCGEALVRISGALGRIRGQRPVADWSAYAAVTADNVLNDYIRAARPNWCRLKRRVLALLDPGLSQGLFARWRAGDAWLGGLARWHGGRFRATRAYQAFCSDREGFLRAELDSKPACEMPLPELVAHLFRRIETPLELNELTGHLAALCGIEDPKPLSLDTSADGTDALRLPAPLDVAGEVIAEIAAEELRSRLWGIILELPERQRTALLLGMPRDALILVSGSMGEAAGALGMARGEMARFWPRLPLPDPEIAVLLRATAKQVSNLRKCARERTARWLARSEKNEPDDSVRSF